MPLENAAVGTPGFGRNVATERAAGKPEKQAVAIAYRQARGDAEKTYSTLAEARKAAEKAGTQYRAYGPAYGTGRYYAQKQEGPRGDAAPSPELVKARKAKHDEVMKSAARARELGDGEAAAKRREQYARDVLAGKHDQDADVLNLKQKFARSDAVSDRKTWDTEYNKLLQKRNAVEREIPLTINSAPDKQQKLKVRLEKIKADITEHMKSKPETKVQYAFGSRKDATGCTFILVDGKTDQVIQHTGNYQAIIAREVRDLKKMDVGRVTTKVVENETAGYAKYGDSAVRKDATSVVIVARKGSSRKELSFSSSEAASRAAHKLGQDGFEVQFLGERKDAEETKEQYIKRTGSNSGYGQKYNPESVSKAIKNNKTGKIGGREGKMIHALLRGRGDAESYKHPPKGQVFKSYGLTYRFVGDDKRDLWNVEGHGEMSSKELYALQAKNKSGRKDAAPATLADAAQTFYVQEKGNHHRTHWEGSSLGAAKKMLKEIRAENPGTQFEIESSNGARYDAAPATLADAVAAADALFAKADAVSIQDAPKLTEKEARKLGMQYARVGNSRQRLMEVLRHEGADGNAMRAGLEEFDNT